MIYFFQVATWGRKVGNELRSTLRWFWFLWRLIFGIGLQASVVLESRVVCYTTKSNKAHVHFFREKQLIDSRENCCSPGQLIMALSPTTHPSSILVLSEWEELNTKNIVYHDDIFTNLLALQGLLPLHVKMLCRRNLGRTLYDKIWRAN